MQQNSSDLRERKRASDRESQRQSRARTKAYIAQLEEAVEAFRRDAAGLSSEKSPTAAQLMQLIEENQQLRAALGRVNRLTKAVLSIEDGKEPPENGKARSTSPEDEQANECISMTSPYIPNTNTFTGPTWPGFLDGNLPTQPFVPNVPIMSLNTQQQEDFAMMSQSIPQSIPGNYFVTLNAHFSQLEKSDPLAVYSGVDLDMDIVIRAIQLGWDEARKVHDFDPVWIGLEVLDRCLWHRCRMPERAAMNYLLRGLLIFKVAPAGQAPRQIPGFQKPTHLQRTLAHPSIIDYFYWPDLRDVLVLSNAGYASEFSAAWFATNLRMAWPFRNEDVFKYNLSTQRYSFSEEFERCMNDLASWTSPFGDANSEVVFDVFKLGAVGTALDPQQPTG